MRKSTLIKQDLQTKRTAQQAIVEGAKNEDGTVRSILNDAETTRFDGLQTEIDGLKAELVRAEAYEENQRATAAARAIPVVGAIPADDGSGAEKKSVESRFDVKRMMEIVVEGKAPDGAEAEVNAIALEELRNSGVSNIMTKGFNVPASIAFRSAKKVQRADAHTVTQDGGNNGGTLVKEDMGKILPSFVDRLAIEDLGVNTMFDLVGDYPLHSVGDFAFQNVEETEGLTVQKVGTSKRVLKPKRTGLMTYISNQLLVQSPHNIMSVLRERISAALNRRLFQDMLNGDGVAPNCLGVLNDAIAFDFAGAAGGLTLAKILELEGEVQEENATEDALKMLIHTRLAAVAKGIPIDQGSGRFLMDMDNKLYGMETRKSTLVPTLNGGTEYPIIYGDWKSVEAGFWGGLNFVADGTTRADSNEVRLIVNLHRDILASNPKAFAANKKITL